MKCISVLSGILFLVLQAQAYQAVDRNRVMDYFQEQQFESAITYMLPVIDSNDLRDLSLLAYAFHQSGKVKEAAQVYERMLSLDSNASSALQNLAGIRLQQQRYPQALAHYRRLLQLRPDNPYVLKQLGTAAYALGLADSGLVWFSRSYQLDPSDEKVVLKLAEHWIAVEQYRIADSLVTKYILSHEPDAAMLLLAVKTSYLLEKYERVIELGDQLQAARIILPSAYVYITAACYRLKRYKDCVAICEYLDHNKMATESILYYAALACTELKEYRKSNALLARCITLAKSDMLETYYHCSSANYESLKQFKPALACLDSSYYLSGQALRLYSMGRIYESGLNNAAAAKKYYRRFLHTAGNRSPEEQAIAKYLREHMKQP